MPGRMKKPSQDLRKQAEEILARKNVRTKNTSTEELQKLITELNIYKTELEIQNENLRDSQKKLEESRSKYSDLYDFAPIGYFTFDHMGVILEVNLTGATLLGVERRSLLGNPFSHFLLPESRPVYRTHLDEIIRKREKRACELKLCPKNKEPFFALMESNADMDETGRVLGVRSALTDISALKDVEEKLSASYATLEEKVHDRTTELEDVNRELEAFTYSVSHDLRSPVRAIDGFIKMIQQEYGKNFEGELLRKFGVIRDNAVRMGCLIDALLDLSRLGRKDLREVPIDMERLAADAVKELEQAEAARNLHIEVEHLPPALGDPTLVRVVIDNLLSNAVKFTKKRSKPAIRIGGRKDGQYSIYYVKDNGVGFDMAYYDKLFGVFQRLHGAEYEGTGIGLATVRRIVERHGGRIWAEAERNKGADFYFSLPAVKTGAKKRRADRDRH